MGCEASKGGHVSESPVGSGNPSSEGATSATNPSTSADSTSGKESSSSPSSTSDSQSSEASSESGQAPPPSNKIDFLFVIDHSGSMESEQAALVASFPGFVDVLKEKMRGAADLHVGVVAASLGLPSSEERKCDKLGALVRATAGQHSSNQDCQFRGGRAYISDPDSLNEEFKCAARLGVSGSGLEVPMDALFAALSPELATDDCNQDFLRDDALLVVTLITDEEDDRLGPENEGSKGDPEDWAAALKSIKAGRSEAIVVLGLIGTQSSENCDPLLKPDENLAKEGAQISKRLESFVKSFGERGLVGDICAPSYDGYFRAATETVWRALRQLHDR